MKVWRVTFWDKDEGPGSIWCRTKREAETAARYCEKATDPDGYERFSMIGVGVVDVPTRKGALIDFLNQHACDQQ